MATTAVAAMTTLHRAVRTWDRVSLFVTPSEFARGTFEKAGFSRGRIRVKPNFLARDPLPGAGSQGYAVFAGRLAQEKGLRTLLQAWRLLRRPMPLKIVGDGPLREELAAMAGGQSTIELLGMQPAEAVYALMGEASFVIVPSECPETFGRVVIEAFAKGAPVVASAIGALPELVEHGRTGLLFRPGDPEDLAANIDWLLTHPAEASRMRREARAEFLAKYTADRNYQMLMEIYESVLAGKPSEAQPVARAAHAAGHAD
jgi:glycosyltransferase involved in cell wall biosynthesis